VPVGVARLDSAATGTAGAAADRVRTAFPTRAARHAGVTITVGVSSIRVRVCRLVLRVHIAVRVRVGVSICIRTRFVRSSVVRRPVIGGICVAVRRSVALAEQGFPTAGGGGQQTGGQ